MPNPRLNAPCFFFFFLTFFSPLFSVSRLFIRENGKITQSLCERESSIQFATLWKKQQQKINTHTHNRAKLCASFAREYCQALSLKYLPRFVTTDRQKHLNSFLNTNDGCCPEFNLLHHWNKTKKITVNKNYKGILWSDWNAFPLVLE